MRLNLRELLSAVTLDTICLYYYAGEGQYKDIFKGEKEDVPEELLDAQVVVIGAKKKNLLDIQLNAEDIPENRKSS